MDFSFALLALIVLLSYSTQVLSGFGSTVIAVALGAQLFPIENLLPVLVSLDFLTCGYVGLRHWRNTDFVLLFRTITPPMLLGLSFGMFFSQYLTARMLKVVLGVFIVLLSARALIQTLNPHSRVDHIEKARFIAYVFSAGVIHGIYASGGPVLVYAVSKLNPNKSVFRSTLTILWLLLDMVLIASYWREGRMGITLLEQAGFLLPVVGLGVFIGEKLHHRINEYCFRIIIFSILLVAGGSLIPS